MDIASVVVASVSTRIQGIRTVEGGTQDNNWLLDSSGELDKMAALQCVQLWLEINTVQRYNTVEDQFSWPWSRSGVYLASSTYRMLQHGRERFAAARWIWKNGVLVK